MANPYNAKHLFASKATKAKAASKKQTKARKREQSKVAPKKQSKAASKKQSNVAPKPSPEKVASKETAPVKADALMLPITMVLREPTPSRQGDAYLLSSKLGSLKKQYVCGQSWTASPDYAQNIAALKDKVESGEIQSKRDAVKWIRAQTCEVE